MSCANPSSSGGGGGGGGGPCGACKFLRRKCVMDCIFAPYFDSDQGSGHFAAVHKVFGASNVSKLLQHMPVHKRLDAVVTICYEAQARLRDPIYGCVAHIFALQQQVVNLQAELSYLQAHLANLEVPTPPPPPPQPLMPLPPLSISDLPSASTVPATYDISSLYNPMVHPSWTMQQQQQQRGPMDFTEFGSNVNSDPNQHGPSSSGDFQALARELLHKHGSS
ncbi:hypothetical protein vseg_018970 [Gypsophila vaccaria]